MMTNRRNHLLTCLAVLSILILSLSACSKAEKARGDAPPVIAQTDQAPSSDDLVELKRQVEIFASDGGQKGEAARRFLKAYPSEELVPDIEALRAQAGDDEIFKMEVAFVLCFFGDDYETNKNKITEALRASRNDRRFDSVGAQSMIRELIRRGDSALLSELFNVAAWSDGALSEGLATTFVEQMVNNPNGFLMALTGVSIDTRRAVYRVTEGSSLSRDEVIEMKKYLSSGKVPSSLQSIARELSASLRSN